MAEAAAAKGAGWQAALAGFVLGLTDWGLARIEPDLRADMQQMERDWLRRHVAPWLEGITALDPGLATRLEGRMEGRLEGIP